MCKLLGAIGVSPTKEAQEKLLEFLEKAKAKMCVVDRDGFGYAALHQSPDGTQWITGEKWVDPSDALKKGKGATVRSYLDDLGPLVLDSGEMYTTALIGEPSKEKENQFRALIAHARFATCDIVIQNTHPFFDETNETVLIHNGVISNHTVMKKYQSTCDSEAILTVYIEENVREKIKNIQKMIDRLSGSYACMILTTVEIEGRKRWVFDVFRNDSSSQLHVAYANELGGYVFGTTIEILRTAAKDSKIHLRPVMEVQPLVFARFDAASGTLMDHETFKDRPVYYYPDRKTSYWQGRGDDGQ